FVDQMVYEIVSEGIPFSDLTTELKMRLLKLPQVNVYFDDMPSPFLVGMSRTTASLARGFEGVSRKINYPEIGKRSTVSRLNQYRAVATLVFFDLPTEMNKDRSKHAEFREAIMRVG